MVTTNRLIPIEAIGSDPPELVHLTGSFQVVARVTEERAAHPLAGTRPARLEVCCDAGRVRGVGLKSGARYEARGAYRLVDEPQELPVPLHLASAFELLRHRAGDPHPAHLLLVVCLRVTIRTDGKVTVGIEDPQLVPCDSP
jgi:hypothetical protein